MLAEFVRLLLEQGRIEYPDRPGPVSANDRALTARQLESVHAVRKWEFPGPPIPFDPDAAVGAAEMLRRAGWYLISRSDDDDDVDARLDWPGRPDTPASHISADLTLRFLPQILRRARAIDIPPDDPLIVRVTETLRLWPLSGVLAEMIQEGPLDPNSLDFGGHAGLQMDYAERLARSYRVSWFPEAGPAREVAAWIFEDLGRVVPEPITRPDRLGVTPPDPTPPRNEPTRRGAR